MNFIKESYVLSTNAGPYKNNFRNLFLELLADYFMSVRRSLYYRIATPCVCSIIVLSNRELNEIINQMLGTR